MARSDARFRLVVPGVVASVAFHAVLLAGLSAIPEPEEEPECPTEVEVCSARCDGKPGPAIPEGCIEPKSCKCELAVVEPIPEIVALPPPPTPPVVPELAPPPAAVPEPVPPPPPPPLPAVPDEASAAKGPTKAKKKRGRDRAKAEAKAKSIAVARVLGTYGDPGENTVFDVLESNDNQLGELFVSGMTTTTLAGSGEISGFAGGDASTLDTTVETKVIEEPEQTLADVVRRKRSSIKKCYTPAAVEAGMTGKLTVSLTANDAGEVTEVTIVVDTLGSDDVRACVIDAVRRWKLPHNQAGDAQFSMVFNVVE